MSWEVAYSYCTMSAECSGALSLVNLLQYKSANVEVTELLSKPKAFKLRKSE